MPRIDGFETGFPKSLSSEQFAAWHGL